MKKSFFILLAALSLFCVAEAQHPNGRSHHRDAHAHEVRLEQNRQQIDHWVDSIMDNLSLREQVAQLMVLRVPLNMTPKQQKAFEKLITHQKVGGVCFFAGTAANQLQLTKRFQSIAHTPLMVCLDAEWGLGMRLTDAYSFPQMMMMGALPTEEDSLVFFMAKEIGLQCRNLGVHVNFAPVVDLNSNPNNPVIGARSFGESKTEVASKGAMYVKGQQSQNVMACAKHFPGHGDTETDSHLDLPVIDHPKSYIDSVDSYPFRQLVKSGVKSVMAAHLQINALDDRPNRPSSLSSKVIDDYLRKDVGFKGLVFTDGIDMKAIAKHFTDGDEALQALLAGCDIILLPQDVETCIDVVVDYAKNHPDFAEILKDKCRRTLREKYKCGLARYNAGELRVPNAADRQRCSDITQRIASGAITLVSDSLNLLPLNADEKIFWVALGNTDTALTHISDAMASRVKDADKVVVSLYGNANPTSKGHYGATPEVLSLLDEIVRLNSHTVLLIYGSPYILNVMSKSATSKPASIVMAYQNMREVRAAMRPILRGDKAFRGHLPVAAGGYPAGYFYVPKPNIPYDPYKALVEEGIPQEYFLQIDSLANLGVSSRIYPGCQILVAQNGKVLYNRGYGRQTYDENSPLVDTATIYDLASLTKVTATTFAIMKLVDMKKISLEEPLSRYLPYLKHTNKSKITIRQTLSHFARLKAFDSYWKKADALCPDLSIREGTMSQCEECRVKILDQIAKSQLNKDRKYVYSDLGFILLADLVEKVTGQTVDIFMYQQFYAPMGLASTAYRPRLAGLDTNRIAPTEIDDYYRHRTLCGEVHDQNAAAMGGVSGHAGLFSTASDLNILYQMMLNDGVYEGKRYLSEEVISTFNHAYFVSQGNRRALGYDKPLKRPYKGGNTAPEVSQSSYGHTGFTGTMVWVDPQYNLVYIFLSNRTYPDSNAPNKLAQSGIRTDIQSLVYQALFHKAGK